MHGLWIRLALATLASGLAASATDWLFMGADALYLRYDSHPEIWRYPRGKGEATAIVWASILPFVTCAVFCLLCAGLHLTALRITLMLALACWLIGPLPLVVTNALFIKFPPMIAAAHACGWLVKLALAAIAVALFVR